MAEQYGALLTACAAEPADGFARGGTLYAFGNGGSSSDAAAVTTTFGQPPAAGRCPRCASPATSAR